MSYIFAMQDGDFAIGEDGDLVAIDGIDMLDQEVGEEISVPYDPDDDSGNKLISRARGIDPSPILSRAEIYNELTASISRLQRIQQEDPFRTPAEIIGHVEQLTVVLDEDDPRDVLFYLDVRNASNEPVEKRKVFSQNNFPQAAGASVKTRTLGG